MPRLLFSKCVAITLVLLSFSLAGCQSRFSLPTSNLRSAASITPPATTPATGDYQYYPLAWQTQVAGSADWSAYLENLILTQTTSLMAGSADVTSFCTNFSNLSAHEKANFWAYLLSEVAYYESGWSPTARYVETTLGTDPVTGQAVVSEGLLQLSYQDQLNYPFCEFNWAADSKLASTDPNKTILNPYINLQCGALILNEQVQNHNLVAINSGAYWSTLEPSGSKLALIQAATQQIPFCSGM